MFLEQAVTRAAEHVAALAAPHIREAVAYCFSRSGSRGLYGGIRFDLADDLFEHQPAVEHQPAALVAALEVHYPAHCTEPYCAV